MQSVQNLIEPLLGLKYSSMVDILETGVELNRTTFGIEIFFVINPMTFLQRT